MVWEERRMRIEEAVKQCANPGEEILWEKQNDREAVVYRKSLMFFSETGLVSAIRDSLTPPLLTESKKLNRYFSLVEKVESTAAKKEAFVSERKLLDSGIDAICLETMDGQRKWINKDLAEAFAFKRKYLFVDPSAIDADGIAADEIRNMVFISEQDKIAGIVMILR